jgi:hypothetical protein
VFSATTPEQPMPILTSATILQEDVSADYYPINPPKLYLTNWWAQSSPSVDRIYIFTGERDLGGDIERWEFFARRFVNAGPGYKEWQFELYVDRDSVSSVWNFVSSPAFDNSSITSANTGTGINVWGYNPGPPVVIDDSVCAPYNSFSGPEEVFDFTNVSGSIKLQDSFSTAEISIDFEFDPYLNAYGAPHRNPCALSSSSSADFDPPDCLVETSWSDYTAQSQTYFSPFGTGGNSSASTIETSNDDTLTLNLGGSTYVGQAVGESYWEINLDPYNGYTNADVENFVSLYGDGTSRVVMLLKLYGVSGYTDTFLGEAISDEIYDMFDYEYLVYDGDIVSAGFRDYTVDTNYDSIRAEIYLTDTYYANEIQISIDWIGVSACTEL